MADLCFSGIIKQRALRKICGRNSQEMLKNALLVCVADDVLSMEWIGSLMEENGNGSEWCIHDEK